jgi:hypothetical protein
MSDVDRRPILLQREIDDIDRAIDSGAKPAWISEIDLHDGYLSFTPYMATFVPIYSQFTAVQLTSEQRGSSTQLAGTSLPYLS